MEPRGIYTLANDPVYDQLVALLNSIEANVGKDLPVCVIPYDERLDKVRAEIASRKNVFLFDDGDSIRRWEGFAAEVWAAHPAAKKFASKQTPWFKSHLQRRFCSFDGPFEKFIFYDCDSLAMKALDGVFGKLDTYDFVFDDWEHHKPEKVSALNLDLIEKTGIYQKEFVKNSLHAPDFFGSKRGILDGKELSRLKELLIGRAETAWINGKGWWDDSFLFCYMTLRSQRSQFNFTQSPDGKDRTGNCANADPFVNINNVLYNEQGQKPIHRIHYMGYGSDAFRRLCKGEDVDIRYRDVFLYYRFLKELLRMPKVFKRPGFATKVIRFLQKTADRIKKLK